MNPVAVSKPGTRRVRRVRNCDLDVAAAAELAADRREPVFVPMRWYVDDRGSSLMNGLQGVMSARGQVNFSLQNPGVVKAWHRHRLQTDFWICVSGQLRAGIHDQQGDRLWDTVFGARAPGTLVIPPGLWHGSSTVGASPAELLYYVTRAYDPDSPDEERRSPDSVPGFDWQVENR